MRADFNLTSTNSTPWIESPIKSLGPASKNLGEFYVLLSGTGSCKVEYSFDGSTVAAPDGETLTGPGSFGAFSLPSDVSHVRVTNISGNSVGSICR